MNFEVNEMIASASRTMRRVAGEDAAKEKSAKEECETVKKYEAGTLWVEKCLTEGGKTYFEYYESGQVRMTGLITKPDLRSGKWMSYFQDGTKILV